MQLFDVSQVRTPGPRDCYYCPGGRAVVWMGAARRGLCKTCLKRQFGWKQREVLAWIRDHKIDRRKMKDGKGKASRR